MATSLERSECARIRRLQIGLRAVKVCLDCRQTRLVVEFREYGWPTCLLCEDVAAAEAERKRQAVIAAAEAEQAERDRIAATLTTVSGLVGSDECACGVTKPRHLPHCRWCEARRRAGVVATARTGASA